MPKRKLSELEEDEPTPADTTTTCGDEHQTTTTASPASPTECTSSNASCVPEAVGDESVPGCSTDTNGPSTSTEGRCFTGLPPPGVYAPKS